MRISPDVISNQHYKPSITEGHGLALITDEDLDIYCPGVSTGGFAEISMALDNPSRHVTATTIDKKGLQETQELVAKYGVSDQITLKLEDVSKPLPYQDNQFDLVYARLVLHYLDRASLEHALLELHRILKPFGKIFIVVRSFDRESNVPEKTIDKETGMTTYPFINQNGEFVRIVKRNLQTVDSITQYVTEAGFALNYLKELEEIIYEGYIRLIPNWYPSKLIELVAHK